MTAASGLSSYPTIAFAAALIAARKLSPVELTQMCLARIRSYDDRLHSFICVLEDAALKAAWTAESEIMRDQYRGPLHGIPIAFKDIFDRKGVPTTSHSRLYAKNIPEKNATVTQRLADAGAIDLGKLALHEFALGGPSFDLPWPPARNPWDTDRFTHGSSSGTAAAIAAGLVIAGPGTDTAGSIRFPAALCGISGLKPTYGRVSRAGVVPLSSTLDHVGPMAWTAEDCALLLQVMAGHDPADPETVTHAVPDYAASLSRDIKGLRIGVVRHFYEKDNPANAATVAAIDAALDVFRRLGAKIADITLRPLADYAATGGVIMISEAFAMHAENLRARPQDYGTIFRNRISAGIMYDADDYARAQRLRQTLRADLIARMADVDVLVTSIVPSEAPLIDKVPMWQSPDKPSMATPFNVTGHPAMALCCGFTDNGLPLSLQIIGKPFDEETVLRLAHAYESATPWRERRPVLTASEEKMVNHGSGATHHDR